MLNTSVGSAKCHRSVFWCEIEKKVNCLLWYSNMDMITIKTKHYLQHLRNMNKIKQCILMVKYDYWCSISRKFVLKLNHWGIILGMGSADLRRRYNITLSLTGCALTQNDPWCLYKPIKQLFPGYIVNLKYTFHICKIFVKRRHINILSPFHGLVYGF